MVGITTSMLTKCLQELEENGFITRKQVTLNHPTVEYSLAEEAEQLIRLWSQSTCGRMSR